MYILTIDSWCFNHSGPLKKTAFHIHGCRAVKKAIKVFLILLWQIQVTNHYAQAVKPMHAEVAQMYLL
jgi:hypothetical protein